MPELKWRDRNLWYGGLWIGQVTPWSPSPPRGREDRTWRGWIMNQEDGGETGWFATEDEAKRNVQEHAEILLR